VRRPPARPSRGRAHHVELYLRWFERQVGSINTVCHGLSVLASFYRWLVQTGLADTTPIAAVRRPPRDETPRQTRLTRRELADWLNTAETAGGAIYAMACLLLFNGQRVSEVCGIDIDDLAEERWHHTVTIHGKGDMNRPGFEPLTKLTVGNYLLERWLPRTRTSPKTRQDRETHMRVYVVPRIGGRRMIELTGDDLTEMYDDLLERGRTRKPDPELGWGLSPSTVRRIHTQLHKAFVDAIRWGLLQRNPCEQSDPPSTTDVKGRALAVRRVYNWTQLQRFVATAADDRLYAMWHLFASTGMRRSEVAALRWQHLDLEVGVISVVRAAVEHSGQVHEKELPKSSTSRRAIELDAFDVDVLRDHADRQAMERRSAGDAWREHDLVFSSAIGGRLYPPDLTRSFHDLTDRAGLPRIRLHDLRHTHATLLLKSGEMAKVVTERLGHSTTAYTQDAYQHVLPGMQRAAARRFRERLNRLDETSTDDPDNEEKTA
jgi:integrase